jgi:hypothetical protein
MRRRVAERARSAARAGALALAALALLVERGAAEPLEVRNTKHDLSRFGPGPVRAESETRICVFCHTPHDATPASPLWNRELPARTYEVYASATLHAGPLPQPTGPTKLCLSCHDGTIAMGAVVSPPGGIAMAGTGFFPESSLAEFGLDLRAHHPVSFAYDTALPHPELVAPPPAHLVFGGADELHCTTCHDPHVDRYGRFLAVDPVRSGLCLACHRIEGWSESAHATSSAPVAGVLPRPPKSWPTWPTLGEWGCEACHTPHFAPTAEHLLNFTSAPPAPFDCTSAGCHGSAPGPPHLLAAGAPALAAARGDARPTDISAQIRKRSAHRPPEGGFASSGEGPGERGALAGAACADCHDPHAVAPRARGTGSLSGLLRGARGVDRHGAAQPRARHEYEICFRCHGDEGRDLESVPRIVASTDSRLEFAPENPSYHPVLERGRNLDVPSIPSTLEPAMRASDLVACSSCHADDDGAGRGPHGSNWAPILVARYDTADGTPESYESYALCYRCHERTSLLADQSFRRALAATSAGGGGHRGHLAAGASCAACHDAHGVASIPGDGTGSHTHLINFDARVVAPLPGAEHPLFLDRGERAGSCALVCHGVVHDGAAYP